MQILLINNDGGGFAEKININSNTTLGQFFDDTMPESNASDFLIRVNREAAEPNRVLNDGDRVTITPKKFEGGR